jgi:polar amino acid transport system substrate-binding protein
MLTKTCVVGIVLLGCCQAALAQIPVAGFPIPGHIESPVKGHFVELTLAIAREAQLAIDIQISPPPRAIESFMQGKSKVLFPALDVFFAAGHPIVRTKGSFNCKEDFVFTKKGQSAYKTLDDLKGKHVGLTQGYPYVKEVLERKDIAYETALSDEANVEKLMKGRLDAFVVEKASGTRAFQNVGAFDNMQVDFKKPVSQQDAYWAFQNNDEGRALAQKFDQALFKLYKQADFYQRFKVGVIEPMGCKH